MTRLIRNATATKTRLLLFIFGVFGAAALLAAIFVGLLWARGYSYEIKNATYSEARKAAVVRVFIPPQARNITAWIMPYRMNIVACFDISEEEFLAWARKQVWNVVRVKNASVNSISRGGDPNDTVEIRDGWLYEWVHNAKDPGSTSRAYAYDRAEGKGYFTQSGD